MLWNTDPDTHRSVRSPAFYGPVALATALTCVSLFSDPLWSQFHLIEAQALNTTMEVGAWGACIRLRNTTGVVGPTKWCSSSTTGYNLYVSLNDTVFYNFPTGVADTGVVLGSTIPEGSVRQIEILSSSKTSLVWFHVIAALALLAATFSLITPPRWINGGKGKIADLQRSGIITLILGAVGFVFAIIAFAMLFTVVTSGRDKFNTIEGIKAGWSSTCSMWFVLPSAIVMIPAYLSVLLPTYVRPADEDETENPMKPLVSRDQQLAGELPQHGGVPYSGSASNPHSMPGTPDSSKGGIKWGLQKNEYNHN